jgi:TolA-binding protein
MKFNALIHQKFLNCMPLLYVAMSLSLPVLAVDKDHENAEVAVTEQKREKSTVQKKAGDGQGKPRLNNAEIFLVEVEKKLVKGIEKTIDYLGKTAISLPKGSDARLEMLTRVHNLHMEQATYVASDEQRVYNEQWEKWDQDGRKGKEPALNSSRSQSHWNLVSETGRNILAEYPKNKGSDLINFNQALALTFMGQEKNAARAFTQLIQKYPNSPVAGDSYFALGDYYFDRNDFRSAQSNFKSALKYRSSKRYGWALFKLGWCYYNLGDYREAQKFWKNTISYAKRAGATQGPKLQEEALRDLVYAFAELKEVEPAIAYLRANGGQKYIGQFLTLLAETFADQGQFKRSISVWQRLQAIIPTSPEAARAQNEIISLNFDLGNLDIVWKEITEYSRLYDKDSKWGAANERQLVLETQVKIQDTALYYSKLVHKNAQKRGSAELYDNAIKAYTLFLKLFPKSREVVEVKYNLADIHFYRKDFRKAGEFYLEIASLEKDKAIIYDEKGKPQKNIHSKAAKYMLDSYNRDFESELKELIKQTPDFKKPPRAISARGTNFIKACASYLKWYPEDKVTTKSCDTFVTEIYFRSSDRKMALKYLWLMATKYSTIKDGPQAVENLIPLYKEDKKGLLIAVNKLLAIPAYQTGATGKKLNALRRAAAIEAIASEKDLVKRAKLYTDRAKQIPGDPDTPKFWNNAAVDYLAGGAAIQAISAYATLVKLHPKNELSQDARLQLGKLYDRRMAYKEAAAYYLEYARLYSKTKEAGGATQRACDLQIADNNPEAVQTCSALIKEFPENAKQAFEKMIEIAWRKKQYDTMTDLINRNYLPRYKLTPNEKVITYYKIYRAYAGKGETAERAGSEIAGILRTSSDAISGEALRYIGEIAFRRSNPALAPYLKIVLKGGTVDAMLGSIQAKTAALESLEKTYGQVLNTKDSYWGIAAYHQIGFAYEQLAGQLKNPPAITGAKIEDVKKELAAPAAKLEAKAREFYTAGLNIAKKLDVYNEWPGKLKVSLARMQGKVVSYDDWIITPDFVGSEVPTAVASSLTEGD